MNILSFCFNLWIFYIKTKIYWIIYFHLWERRKFSKATVFLDRWRFRLDTSWRFFSSHSSAKEFQTVTSFTLGIRVPQALMRNLRFRIIRCCFKVIPATKLWKLIQQISLLNNMSGLRINSVVKIQLTKIICILSGLHHFFYAS